VGTTSFRTLCALSLSGALLVGCGDDDGDADIDEAVDEDTTSGERDAASGAVTAGMGSGGRGGSGGGGADGGPDDAGSDADLDAASDEDAASPPCTTDCDPKLTGLVVSAGTLTPEFEGAETMYALSIGLVTQRIVLTPTAPEGVAIEIDGDRVDSGDDWQSDVLDLGVTEIAIAVSQAESERVYTLTVTRAISGAYLKASNAEGDDDLGSVAISGDTLVAGAPGEDSSAVGVGGDATSNGTVDSGAVFVFVRGAGGNWSQQAYLKASNTGGGDEFGASVAIDTDTIVVGAPGESSAAAVIDGDGADDTRPDAGAAYVFVRTGTAWSQQAYLKPHNTDTNDGFGSSVAISGDTIAVGAPLEDSSALDVGGDASDDSVADSGAAYVFVRAGVAWTAEAYLKASNTGASDLFGADVAISGDTIAVGAYLEDSEATGVGGDQGNENAQSSGAVYVFARSGATWSPEAYVKATNSDEFDEFGHAVALSGDTLVVGASLEDSGATGVGGNQADETALDSGAAYVYGRSGSVWTSQAYLKAVNAGPGDTFGWSVAIDGDAIVVGARLEDGSATGVDGADDEAAPDSGAAYLFLRDGTTWAHEAHLKASNTASFDQYGQAVAVSGDTVAVTAPGEDSNSASDPANENANESGAVYVIR
jgi:hypothetical protein